MFIVGNLVKFNASEPINFGLNEDVFGKIFKIKEGPFNNCFILEGLEKYGYLNWRRFELVKPKKKLLIKDLLLENE